MLLGALITLLGEHSPTIDEPSLTSPSIYLFHYRVGGDWTSFISRPPSLPAPKAVSPYMGEILEMYCQLLLIYQEVLFAYVHTA